MTAIPPPSPARPSTRPAPTTPRPLPLDKSSGGAPPALDDEQRATLALSHVEGIGPATLRALKASFRTLAGALRRPRADLLSCLRTPVAREALLAAPDFEELAQATLGRLRELGARPIFPDDDGWPAQLRAVSAPPILYVRGTLAAFEPRLAVVGARAVDDYGLSVTRFWAGVSARKGIAIVSGGARGVDSQAHRAALAEGGVTIAVLGTGVDQVYPSENTALFERIVEGGGALVSQFPLGTPPLQHNFIQRNTLIASLADATLVTRAGPSSGALTTAKAARQAGRSVFVLPGDLTSRLSWGTQWLVDSGLARPISGLEPIGRLMNIEGPWPSFFPGHHSSVAANDTASPGWQRPASTLAEPPAQVLSGRARCAQAPPPKAWPAACRPPLEGKILNVFNGLTSAPRQFDELLAQSDLDAAGLADALLRLELLGLCEELPGRFFRRASSGR